MRDSGDFFHFIIFINAKGFSHAKILQALVMQRNVMVLIKLIFNEIGYNKETI